MTIVVTFNHVTGTHSIGIVMNDYSSIAPL